MVSAFVEHRLVTLDMIAATESLLEVSFGFESLNWLVVERGVVTKSGAMDRNCL